MGTSGKHAFDGPGGQLAHATPGAIVLDADEKWEVSGATHPRRKLHSWGDGTRQKQRNTARTLTHAQTILYK